MSNYPSGDAGPSFPEGHSGFENHPQNVNTTPGQMQFHCPHCQAALTVPAAQAGDVVACPSCGGRFQSPLPTAHVSGGHPTGNQHFQNPGYPGYDPVREFASKKLGAGLCGILLGGLGIHKFILGFNNAGILMLVVSLGGAFLGSCLILPFLITFVIQIIGLIEGIMYLTKSDHDFYQTYAVERREWF